MNHWPYRLSRSSETLAKHDPHAFAALAAARHPSQIRSHVPLVRIAPSIVPLLLDHDSLVLQLVDSHPLDSQSNLASSHCFVAVMSDSDNDSDAGIDFAAIDSQAHANMTIEEANKLNRQKLTGTRH